VLGVSDRLVLVAWSRLDESEVVGDDDQLVTRRAAPAWPRCACGSWRWHRTHNVNQVLLEFDETATGHRRLEPTWSRNLPARVASVWRHDYRAADRAEQGGQTIAVKGSSTERRRSECLTLELEDGITAAKGRLMAW